MRTPLAVILVLVCSLSACAADTPAPPATPAADAALPAASDTAAAAPAASDPAPPPMVGGDRDAHGCIPSAGYTWCEETKQCERSWELAKAKGFESTQEAFNAYCKNGAR